MKKLFVVLAVLALVAAPSFAQFVGGGTASGSVTVDVACLAEITVQTAVQNDWITVNQVQTYTVGFDIKAETGSSIGWTATYTEDVPLNTPDNVTFSNFNPTGLQMITNFGGSCNTAVPVNTTFDGQGILAGGQDKMTVSVQLSNYTM